jgi:hypothetical protein
VHALGGAFEAVTTTTVLGVKDGTIHKCSVVLVKWLTILERCKHGVGRAGGPGRAAPLAINLS